MAQQPKLSSNTAECGLATEQGRRGEPGHPAASQGSGSSLSLQVWAAEPSSRAAGAALGCARGQNCPRQHPWVSSSAGTALGSSRSPGKGHFPGHPGVPGPATGQTFTSPLHGKATSALDHTSAISALSTPAASTQKTQMECKYLWNPSGGLTHPHTRS